MNWGADGILQLPWEDGELKQQEEDELKETIEAR